MQFLVIFGFFSVVMIGFVLSLKFSRYKQRPEKSSCCGAGYCEIAPGGQMLRKHEAPEDHVCCKEQ